jgi:S-adenosylmethionine decarboxylase
LKDSGVSELILGKHLLVELYGCDPALLDDAEFVKAQCVAAAEAMGARVVVAHAHRFQPVGVSVVVVLAESHLALHTWPEHEAASMDIFICKPAMDPRRATAVMAQNLRASSVADMEIARGDLRRQRPRRWRHAEATPSLISEPDR